MKSYKTVRISKQLEKRGIPAAVAAEIRRLGEDYRLHSFTVEQVPANNDAGRWYYAGEGHRYSHVRGTGECKRVEMVSESSLGAAGVSHQIGAKFLVPVGDWLITIWYYSGFGMRVENVGLQAIGGAA